MKGGRTGYTTGTCAAAAAKAAATVLCHGSVGQEVEIGLPDNTRIRMPVSLAEFNPPWAKAAVRKDAGDDPDVTHGCLVVAEVGWGKGRDIAFFAGDGVGVVTKPGLSVPPGEPAINPVPRQMIRQAVKEVTKEGLLVRISIPGGTELASKTFNPRLGIIGGLSILGTSGIVRPFSAPALQQALLCALHVAAACGVLYPVFVPGRIGHRAACRHLGLSPEQIIEVSNQWGFMLDKAVEMGFGRLLALGHPGKLAKLAAGQWDTHSSRAGSALPLVAGLACEVLGYKPPKALSVEGIFVGLPPYHRSLVGRVLASRIRDAMVSRTRGRMRLAVALVDMKGELLGTTGDLETW